MDLKFVKFLKKDLRTSHIPIIILTASDTRIYLKALESGSDVFQPNHLVKKKYWFSP
jgi:CheY-like chemotaxis protein